MGGPELIMPAPSPRRRRTPTRYGSDVRFWLGLFSLFGASTLLLLGLWVATPVAIMGWHPVVISGASMSPAIRTGDVVVVRPHNGVDLGEGTVITFRSEDGSLVTHRIAGGENGMYRTRGDASGQSDSALVRPSQVVGVGALLVPFVGRPALWAASGRWLPLGLAALTMAAALAFSGNALGNQHDPWIERGLQPRPPRYLGAHSSGGRRQRARQRALTTGAVSGPLLNPVVAARVFSDLDTHTSALLFERRRLRGALAGGSR
ncbi:MAG: signal peptidase I [Acidimicrobiales bacterium]